MKQIKFLFKLSILLFLFNCGNSPKEYDDSDFSKVENLSNYKNTMFLTSLNSKLDKRKNGVYAATLNMAWDEIKKVINDSIISIESQELKLMNESNYHLNVLKKIEYKTSIEVIGGTIKAEAYFKKLLPFPYPLTDYKKTLKFNEDTVNSFGFNGKNSFTEIEYYNNDNDFALKLNAKDKNHEIILLKFKFNKPNFEEIIKEYKLKYNKGLNQKLTWKKQLEYEDIVRIPMINFNLETNFKDIENTNFNTDNNLYTVIKAYQRNAFIFNEKGAKVESKASVATKAIEEITNEPKPKKLLFNKPFIILLKRKDSENPYFALYIANTELLKK